ncbi:fimbrial protein [Atlantibacter hermannii]|uniref:fimbrial protein n=1 Tax=Atlantibacter hermannii TaxID=565 RepID=UPI001C6FFF4D|nr:fimbrial protein [Atlantibacter hermannii]MBW9429297.1 fimbrial protein [Atlantibacter hermannii]
MSLKKILTFLIIFLFTKFSAAECTLRSGSYPQTFTLPPQVITIDADRPMDTSTPIFAINTGTQPEVVYDYCVQPSTFGKSVMNLINQDTATKIFPTNIPGIGIKVRWNNGAAFGDYPSTGQTTFSTSIGAFIYPATSFFRIELYKTQQTLNLSNKSGDLVLPAEEIAYNWILVDSPDRYAQRLTIGPITLISTPSCTYDNSKSVDFGTVTTNTLTSSGIARDLDFTLICKTDYGSYSASASITTDTPTPDSKYIKVKDAAGNMDRLGIKITNSKNADMLLDGTTQEKFENITTGAPAQFNWRATLYPMGNGKLPENGEFTARAEILLQVK